MQWKNDNELFQLIDQWLYTPVVGDILDSLEYYHQFLPQAIRPLQENMKVIGRAMPVLTMDVYGNQEEPFGLMTQALDDLQEGEVYISAGAEFRSATWGEIMTATAKMRKARGAVVYGYHRDTPQVLSQHFPVFSLGHYAQDSGPRMKIAEYRTRIQVGDVWVKPGDLVFGDIDGVLIIPREVEEDVLVKALEKAKAEKVVRKEIESGRSSTEVFKEYGIF